MLGFTLINGLALISIEIKIAIPPAASANRTPDFLFPAQRTKIRCVKNMAAAPTSR
jgi:hypothetical protein